jgi:hypothetical protein
MSEGAAGRPASRVAAGRPNGDAGRRCVAAARIRSAPSGVEPATGTARSKFASRAVGTLTFPSKL